MTTNSLKKGYKGLEPMPQYGTTLKGDPSSRAPCRIMGPRTKRLNDLSPVYKNPLGIVMVAVHASSGSVGPQAQI